MEIILDTTVLKTDLISTKVAFAALKQAAGERHIKIVMPNLIRYEFQTQKEEEAENHFSQIRKALEGLKSVGLTEDVRAKVEEFGSFIGNINIRTSVADTIGNLLNELNGMEAYNEEHDLQRMIQSYFRGDKPFKKRKDRTGIPDQLIWLIVSRRAEQSSEPLFFISNDSDFDGLDEDISGLHIYKSVEAFMSSEHGQALRELSMNTMYHTNIRSLVRYTPSYTDTLHQLAEGKIEAAIRESEMFQLGLLNPGGKKSIRIENIHVPIYYDQIGGYGRNHLLIPFEGSVRAEMTETIPESDQYKISSSDKYTVVGHYVPGMLQVAYRTEHTFTGNISLKVSGLDEQYYQSEDLLSILTAAVVEVDNLQQQQVTLL